MLHPQSKSATRAHRHAGDDGFVLEMMEPRILLSGAPVDLPQPVVDLAPPPPPDASSDQVVMMIPGSTSLSSEITATPSAILLQSVFGETEALPAATEATVEPLTPENADQSAELKTVQVTAKADEKAAEPLLPAALEVGLTDSKAQPASNTMTGELVETLRAANGPPANAAFSSDVTNSSDSTIYKNSETGATSGSRSVPAQLIIIDGAVSGFSPLIEGLQSGNSNVQVLVLDSQSDGIQQITELLKNFRNLDAIHILAHGGDGALRLGNLVLNDSKLAENGQSIASWGAALKSGGDILLYGCDVAQSDKGAQFVSQLAQVTGADFAASTNATGAASLGGDWVLEFQTGAIEAGVPFAAEAMAVYSSLLDSLPSLTLSSGDTTTVTIGSTVTVGIGGTNYTNLTVTGTAALNGTLAVSIANGFNIAAGQTFDLLTAGSVTGTFTNATGLFNNGGLYFEIVQTAGKLQLVVKEVPGNPAGTLGLQISAALQSARDALGTVFNDYFVNPPAFTASLDLAISSFATLSGTFGVQKIGGLITLVAQNASAILSAGSASVGISAANLAVLLNTNGTRVVYGTGQFAITAGSSFVNASGTVTLTENTTASATTSQTVTVSGVTVNVPAIDAGVQSLAGTGLSVDVNGFVTLTGDFGFKKGASDLEIVANNASALLTTSAASIGLTSATLGLLLKSTGGIALSASGTPVLNLPTTFASVGATSVGVDYNSTGAAVSQTLMVGGISLALRLPTGSVASPYNTVTVTGFTASIADFVTLSGNFGFQKSGTDLLAAATNATARLEAGSTVKAGVTGATVGLIIKSDQKFALQTTGGTVSLDLGSGFASATATSINVAYNNTGADVNTALSITAGGSTVSANVVVANGANAVSVTGLDATVANFVRITGDFGVRKDSGDLIVAGSNASAVLESGTMKAGVSGVTLGLIVKPDFTLALQASGAAQLNLGSGFASATATSASVSFNNTGVNVNRSAAVVIGSTSVSAPVVVNNGVTTVTVTGFLATLVDFVTLSGDFGFQKDSGDIIAAATGASASLSVSSVVHAGVSNATFGLLLKSNGTLAIDGNGAADINLGPSFGSVTATSVTVKFNNTGANVARTLTIGSITAPLNALNNDIVVSAAGFNATINNFATITGDLGFRKTSAGLIVVGQNVDAKLSTGVLDVGITNGKVGMIINPFNRVVLQAEGGLVLNLGSGSFTLGSVTADRVKVEFNNTGVDVNTTVTVGSLTQDINVKKSTISLSAFNFHAQILDFIDISGDLSFKKLTLGDFNLPGFPSLPTWDPSLPNINLPTIPDFAGVNLPSLPGLPGLPGWPTTNLPDFPEFDFASLPSLPSLGSLPNLGDFGLGGFSIAGINLDIGLSIPGFSIGTFKADFGMLMDGFGKFALDIHGLPKFDVGLADIGSIGAQEVEVKFNNTSVDVSGSAKDVNGNAKAVQVEKGLAELNIKGFYAILNNVVQFNGDFGFQLGANRTEIIGVGQNVSAKLLPTTPSSVFDLGITNGTMAMVIKKGATLTAKPTIAVSAAGTFQASLGGGLVGVSATSAGLSFNNTGVDEDRAFTIGTITQSLKAKAGVTAVTATGLNATINQFVTLTGDFGFQHTAGGDINVTANNASATLTVGSQSIGVTGATLGMILKADGKIAMQATGPQALNLGVGFASVSATSVTVAYNNTGAAVNTTLTVGGIVAPINVANNTTAISATGLVATISEFVTISGNFGFSKTTGGDIVVAASGASAKLTAGPTIEIGVSNATIGLLILSNGKIALDASGALAMNLGSSFASVSATNVTVKYNNTGADVNTSVTMGAVTATINVADGVTAITSTGFSATIVNFVTLTGDFGFKKSTGGDIIVVAQNAAANLVVGGLSVGVTGATVGLIIKPDSKIALQGRGNLNFNLGTAFASVSAASAAIAFNNTGANVNTTVTVGALSAPIVVDDNTIAVSMIGFQASIADFVTLKGDFAFKKSGSDMAVAVTGASATLTVGSFEVGVTSATLGLLVTAAGKIALQASGTPRLVLPGNFDGISATSVTVSYNNTGADVNTSVVIGSVNAPIVVTNNTTSISVTGFEASLLDFVTVKGNFGFQKSGNDMIIAASGASATLKVGTTEVGVTDATLGLIIKDGGGTILQATGAPRLVLPVDFATVTASSVSVAYNSTASAVNTTLNVGGITATVNVAANTTAVTVTGLNATITDFVTINGNFGFKKSGSDVVAIANNVSAIMSGSGFSVGLTSASLALLLKSDGSFAVQASGTPVLTIPVDMSSVLSLTITTLSVGYNSTGAAIDTTLTVGALSAPLKVSSGTKASPYLAIGGSGSITIAGFITVSGDFGFSKSTDSATDTTKIKIGAANVTGTGDSDKYGLTNGTLGLVLFRKTSNSTSLGYAMEAKTTGYLQASGSVSAQATVTLRRNTTTFAVNEIVPVLTREVPVVFSASEVAKNGTPFNTVAMSDAIIKIGDITIKGSYASQPNGPNGESITKITDASLEFGDPMLFKITAASVTYKSFSSSVTLGGVTYADGVQQVIITGGEIQLGDVITLSGSFNIIRSKSAGTPLTNVGFTGLGISLKVDGRVMVTVAGDGAFHYGGADGFQLDSLVPTSFNILPDRQPGYTPPAPAAPGAPAAPASSTPSSPPQSITLGPLTLTNPDVTLTNFGLGFEAGQIVLKVKVTIGVETASLLSPGGTGAKITDGTDADKFGISGSFDMDVLLDPANDFAPSGVNTGNFQLKVDKFELNLGSFLILKASDFTYNPSAPDDAVMFHFGSAEAAVNAGPLAIGGGAEDFSILGNGDFVAGPNFAITLTLGGGTDAASTFKTPEWMPLKNLRVTLRWEDDNFTKDPSKFLIVLDADVATIKGMSGVSVTGGFKGLTIDVEKLAAGEFAILSIDSFNVGISGEAFGGQISASLVMGVVKLDADYNIIESGSSTPVARRFFYGGIQGGITLAGMGKVDMRLGFSDFGPLSFFISASIPIVVDAVSGLTLDNLRGGVDFGAKLDDPTVYELNSQGEKIIDPTTGVYKIDAQASAFALRALKLANNPTDMTSSAWENSLRRQIARIIKNGGGNTVSFDDLAKNIVIHAGATLYTSYTSKLVFHADVDLSIDITGKILLTGTATFNETKTMDAYFYADLTQVASGSARFLFLFDDPGSPLRNLGGISLYGLLDIGLVDSTGKRLAAADLQDKYFVTKTKRDTFTWNASASSTLMLEYTPVTSGADFTVIVGTRPLASSEYTLTNGNTITLTTAPADGEKIAVDYSYKDFYGIDADGNPIANPASQTPEADGFQILIAGGLRADVLDNTLFVQLSGQLTLTFTSTQFTIDVSAKLEVSILGVLGAAAGRLVVQYEPFAIWGALKVASGDGLRKLEEYGIKIQAQITITINTTKEEKQLDMQLPATKQARTTDIFDLAKGDSPTLYMSHSRLAGGSLTVKEGSTTLVETVDYDFDPFNSIITLRPIDDTTAATKNARKITVEYDSEDYLALHVMAKPESLNVVATVLATFSIINTDGSSTEFFRMHAAISMTIGSEGFSLILVGKLMIGDPGDPFLSFDTTALVYAGVIDGKFGFAAMFKVSLKAMLGPFGIDAVVLVQTNTFGKAVVFNIPNVNPAFPTITDENGQSIEKEVQQTSVLRNSDGTERLDANGNKMTTTVTARTVSISGGAPRLQGGFEADAPYFMLRGKGTLNLIDSEVSGQFYISLTPTKLRINVSGEMTYLIVNKFLVAGDLTVVYEPGKFYAYGGLLATRKTGNGDPLEAFGVYLSATGIIVLNTDSEAHTINLIIPGNGAAQNITIAKSLVEFRAKASVSFRVDGKELFRIEGAVIIGISTDPVGSRIIIEGELKIGADTPLFVFKANAAIYVGALPSGKGGFAAMIAVTLDSSFLPGVEISGGFLFMTNTFGEDVHFDLGEVNDPTFTMPTIKDETGETVEKTVSRDGKTYRQVTIPGGAPKLTGDGFEEASPYVLIRGNGEVNILDSFVFTGRFGILLTPTKFQLSVSAALNLGPFGDVEANGFLEISANGIVGAFSLTVDTGEFGKNIGLEFDASFTFAVNTLGEKRTVTFIDSKDKEVTLEIDEGVRIKVKGTIVFAGVLDADAEVDIQISEGKFQLDGTAGINLAGGLIKARINLHVLVTDNGFALVTDIDINTTLAEVIDITASGKLYINTGVDSVTLGGVNVEGQSVFFNLSGKLSILDIFTFDVSITAQVGGTFVREGGYADRDLDVGQWAFSFSASASFFDLATIGIRGWIMYDGSFWISLSGKIMIGNTTVGFSLGVEAHIGYDVATDDFSFGASVTGTFYIFGLKAELSLFINYRSSDGALTLDASASGTEGDEPVTREKGWVVGYLQKPKPIYLGMDSKGNRLSGGSNVGASGELHLTMGAGDNGTKRNFLPDQADTTYTVSHVSTQSDGSETVKVSFGGRSKEYSGVRKIVLNGTSGKDELYINDGVTSQLQLDGGGGDDTFMISGGSSGVSNVIKGGDGDDFIQISDGNTRSYTISGDGGTNTLLGGNGNDTFNGGSGTDFITAGLGADTFYSGTGRAYILGDAGANGSGSSTPREISSNSAAGSADTFYVKTGTNYIIGGAGNDRIYGGGENYVVGDNGAMEFDSSGKVTKITAEGSAGGNDYFDSLGGSGTSIFLAGAGSDTIKGGNDTNIVLGGNGTANFDAGKILEIISDELTGDDDTITLGDGLNVTLGGGGKDTITGGNGKSNIGGDNGKATFFEDGKLKEFTDGDINGDDILVAGNGNSVIIGGGGNDTITAGNGNSVLIGDEGTAKFNSDGFLLEITTANPSNGGNDTITAGNGTNVIFGGSGQDIIRLGVGYSVAIGDNGKATFTGSSILSTITTLDPNNGGADNITGANGNNVIFGGAGADTINVNDLGDVILGDHGSATFNSSGLLVSLTSSDAGSGDADIITTGIGSNVIFGGAGADQITAGVGNNIILGDSGRANFNIGGGKSILSSVSSTDAASGGADRITAGNGKNIFFGGAGADYLSSGSGFSILAGDGASASFDSTGLLVSIQSVDASVGSGDTIRATDGRTIVLGGAGGDDIATGRSDDVILGDNGIATFVTSGGTPSGIGSIVFSNDGILTSITSTDTSVGGDDIITVSDGFNVIVGGLGADQITGGAERDIVIGDNGRALFDNTGVLTLIESTDAAVGGSSNDNIIVGNGPDTVIGGNGKDNIQAAGDISDDVIIGDNGRATFDSTAGQSILRDIISTDTSLGDDDTINAGDGYNIVVGGAGKDLITGGANTDVILGDSGHAVFNADGVVTFITTTSPSIGDNDNITFGAGTNTVFGGVGADTLTGLEGTDVIVGDNGNATFTNTGLLTFITTSAVANGGDDVINTGAGFNTVLGGSGKDNITGGINMDIVIGDNGNATFDPTSGESIIRDIISTDTTVGDDDIIVVGDGFNVILAGFGADQVTGGAGDDVILGDNGHAVFNATGIVTYITTIEPTVGGNDIIKVGDGSNVVLSGFGADEVTGGVDGDVVIGDHGNATFTDAGIMTYITTTEPGIGGDDIIKVADGFNVVLAGYGADQVTGGNDRDVVLGDNGNATFTTVGVLTYVTTSDPSIGSDDVIVTGNGFNVIFAGIGGDRITGGTGRDVILGDNGNATFDSTGGQSILRDIISTETDIGGADIIDGGSGNNIIIGGTVNDTVTTGGGDDIVLGDSGHAVFNAAEILTYITVITPGIGGDDIISVGDGFNIVLGGFGKDTITGGNGVDFVLGDNGYAIFDDLGVLTYLTTTDHAIGDDDRIFTLGGDDLIFGGTANDFIDSGSGNDSVFGDFGYYSLEKLNDPYVLNPRGAVLLEEETGGNDTIFGGSGDDLIYGEGGDDFIDAQEGDDTVVAGYGDDVIHGGDGNDILMGGPGGDFFDSGWGADTLYVDLYDGWNGGMPQDTIMGGPFFSTNTQLAFGLPVLGGGSTTTTFDVSITATQLSIIIGDGESGGYQLAVDVPASILVPNPVQLSFSINFNDLRWGGSGSSFALLALGEIHATLLLGIGEFLEVLWSDLMALYS